MTLEIGLTMRWINKCSDRSMEVKLLGALLGNYDRPIHVRLLPLLTNRAIICVAEHPVGTRCSLSIVFSEYFDQFSGLWSRRCICTDLFVAKRRQMVARPPAEKSQHFKKRKTQYWNILYLIKFTLQRSRSRQQLQDLQITQANNIFERNLLRLSCPSVHLPVRYKNQLA